MKSSIGENSNHQQLQGQKKNPKSVWKPCFEYKVDYNDHFETPLVAYEDILPLLDAVAPDSHENHVIYDPYYCNGRTAVLLRKLGFSKVVHEKKDFYKDIKNNTVPEHDTLVTNPPYSDSHKESCLQFCVQQFKEKKRKFFLLMPNYVAARNYCRRILESIADDVVYLVPSTPYEYDHPEGTGHEISPFSSLWFCGIGRENASCIEKVLNAKKSTEQVAGRRLAHSLDDLGRMGVISTDRRPNPRQRRAKKKRAMAATKIDIDQNRSPRPTNIVEKQEKPKAVKGHKPKKQSRYRDHGGKRTKKRF